MAVGLTSGTVELLRLNSSVASPPGTRDTLDAPKAATLPVKYQRPCYAVSLPLIYLCGFIMGMLVGILAN